VYKNAAPVAFYLQRLIE